MIMPDPLYHGAKVALLCPSAPLSADQLSRSSDAVRALGLDPVPFPSCRPEYRRGCFAADDARRAEDLQEAFSDPDIQGILCLGGGYGAGRLLPLINWKAIARQPKVFCGSGDATLFHIVLNQTCRLVTCHIPEPGQEQDVFTTTCLQRAFYSALSGPLDLNGCGRSFQSGRAEGRLCGGSLSRICHSLGTPWELNTRGKVLFLEEEDTPLSHIDAMLAQLRNAGKLEDCAAILTGRFSGCTPEDPESALTLDEIFEELLLPSEKPILADLPTMSLPLGAEVLIDADAKLLEVLA